MIINTWRDPYEAGFSPTRPKQIEFNPGLTVLIGCNGAGKSTLINNIKAECKDKDIPVISYDNLKNGGSTNAIGAILAGFKEYDCDSMESTISLLSASEGETIKLNIERHASLYKKFLQTGTVKDRNPLVGILGKKEEKEIASNLRVFLFDASDSGVSIDSICEIKDFFHFLIKTSEEAGLELYIIASANEYELCDGEQCFDVNSGKYLTFADYSEYKTFILKSRERKEIRILKQIEWYNKQAAKEKKEFIEYKAKTLASVQEIEDGAKAESRELNAHERWEVSDLKRSIDSFKRKCKHWDGNEEE